MISPPTLRKSYLFIRRSRFRKKLQLFKKAVGVMVDVTTSIYLLVLGGYAIAAFFIAGDFMAEYHSFFIMIEEQAAKYFWVIMTMLPILYINQSFSHPGVVFTSTEYQLSMLPYRIKDIWLMAAAEKWLKGLIMYGVICVVVILITPISASLVITYAAFFWLFDVMVTIPQWKLFQTGVLTKIAMLLTVSAIASIGLLTDSSIIGWAVMTALLILNIRLSATLFKQENWEKITAASDYQLWNMPVIALAADTKFKRNRIHGILKRSKAAKKPLPYTRSAIGKRLWTWYLTKQYALLFKVIGALFAWLFVLVFIDNLYFHIGMAIVVHVYAVLASNLFTDRFHSDLMRVLPWDLPGYKQSFVKIVLYGSLLFLIPTGLFFILHGTLWAFVKIPLFASVFYYVIHVKMNMASALLAKRSISFELDKAFVLISLILVGLSGIYPTVSLGFPGVLWLAVKSRKQWGPASGPAPGYDEPA